MKRKAQKALLPPTVIAETTEGANWLEQLTEPLFRDEVLKELFSQMKKGGFIEDYLYNHGRGEHGVDWVVYEKGGLSLRYVGIQAKSKKITLQGDAKSDSALKIKMQCGSAFDHQFNWNGNKIRLDVVELWMSAYITPDSEAEFNATSSHHKIAVKRASEVFKLIDRFCPRLVSKIPGLAETGYIKKMANPEPLPIRIFGIQLNPRRHFLEPRFSRHDHLSLSRVFDRSSKKMEKEHPLTLEDILNQKLHVIIVGSELSGKTYLLKRISCIVADQGHIPVMIDGSSFSKEMPKSVPHLLHKYLDWYPLKILQNPEILSRTIYLLIDNADLLNDDQLGAFRESSHSGIIMMATAKKPRTISGYSNYFISGIKDGAIQRFIRSLDFDSKSSTSLTDRAINFIQRTIGTSGLPSNPFTVSVMLSECQIAKRKLATPTMGRLIERFVDTQIGSHLDAMRVDFETKSTFLSNLGGTHQLEISRADFRKRLVRFLSIHAHAHDISDFEQDLFESGLIERDEIQGVIKWTHPIFCDFFWIRNLIREKKYNVIADRLLQNAALSIAAITGSQMGDAHEVLNKLISSIRDKDWMVSKKTYNENLTESLNNHLLPSDSEEETLLNDIEEGALKYPDSIEQQEKLADQSSDTMNIVLDEDATKSISLYATRLLDEKHYIVGNVGALLVNSRNLSRDDKEIAVKCILHSNARMANYLEKIQQVASKRQLNPLNAKIFATFLELIINDSMMGDAFLSEIFYSILKSVKSDSEKIMLIDLLVICRNEDPGAYMRVLNGKMQLADMVAVYIRLVYLYYFRFHKEKDKNELKDAMKSIRKLAKGVSLPPIT